ncbi:rod shape-determining protein MreC [Adlercreutzia sp. R21]|uniref:Cell shape-determining protein MreC n=1 Tax=Adlercreutzia wanghongyangiae TaxID=3111451 RepID=A0ABU6IG79_9ACTN|nr:rod shape-determining protein MreC [Adlercreutzia sp. R21]MEC4175463.1 rod shape-determining protein MreC [Adlercreutzia sp. R7]MEC4183316.1 rod shape-determining protein MreC [Adlercreutzia sp. R21]
MALNFQNNSPAPMGRVPLIITLVLAVALIGVYAAEGAGGPLHKVQTAVEGAVAPLQQLGIPLGTAVEGAGEAAEDAAASPETLAALKDQNAQLAELAVQAEEYRLAAQRLEALLGMRDAYDIEGPVGRVIGRSTDAWNQDVTLDVGSNQGVETGLTVMGATGVIGQVISVSPNSCRVRLLSDPQSGAAAMVQSNRAEGIVRGSLDGLLYLENIGADVNIQVGDVVLTSGLGGSYTPGLIIGTVARVEGSAGNDSRRIVVAPNGSVALLEEATVVLSAASDAVDRSVPVVPVEGGDAEADGAADDAGMTGGDDADADDADADTASSEGDGN